jgi:acetyltransferase-like isoleucine patch superfamily enzyme
MDLQHGADISLKARLDFINPRGIHIGSDTAVNFDAVVLSHDFVNNKNVDTRIGRMCFIGARSIIYPGVTIGDHCIIAVAAVVTSDIPSNSIAAGNPARVIEKDIVTGPRGMLIRVQAAAEQA